MKTLLDIGSRNGESLEEFVRWDFEIIHSFEPMPAQYANIVAAFGDDDRVITHNFGLSDVTGTKLMYGADDKGEASVFSTKIDLDSSVVTECSFVEASAFFAEHVEAGVFVKMNCEGSEVAILHNLMDSGEIAKIRALRFEMDISRVPDHAHEADVLLARLDRHEVPYVVSSDARLVNGGLVERMDTSGTHHERLHAWLTSVGA